MQTRFILINTSHAGNVGAAARAIKTMGFDDLVLVAPRWANVLRREETIQRASGALDVLDKCRIVDTLDEAVDTMGRIQLGKKFSKSENADIVAFLKTLTGEQPVAWAP